jgi:hypothetical protein
VVAEQLLKGEPPARGVARKSIGTVCSRPDQLQPGRVRNVGLFFTTKEWVYFPDPIFCAEQISSNVSGDPVLRSRILCRRAGCLCRRQYQNSKPTALRGRNGQATPVQHGNDSTEPTVVLRPEERHYKANRKTGAASKLIRRPGLGFNLLSGSISWRDTRRPFSIGPEMPSEQAPRLAGPAAPR